MAEFAVVESGNAEVGLKFASAAMPERDIVEFFTLYERRKKHLNRDEGTPRPCMLKRHAASQH